MSDEEEGFDPGLEDPTASAAKANAKGQALIARIAQAPYRYHFLRMMRELESAHPEQPRLGLSKRAQDDPVRLGQEPALTFAPSDLEAIRYSSTGVPRVSGHFFGLLGPNGPMPLHFTEYVRDRALNADDPTLSRFLDIFHHRMICLFYRAWAQAQPAVHADRPEDDRFAFWAACLVGMGSPSLQSRASVDDEAVFHRLGHFASQSRSADGLREALEDFFQVRVELHEFVGEWLSLPPESYLRLGGRRHDGALGVSATLGARVWSAQTRFRIFLDQLSLEAFERFLPGGESLPKLVSLVRMYCGDELAFDLQLGLCAEQVPPLSLGAGARLGLTAWLGDGERAEDSRDAVFEPRRYEDGCASAASEWN